MVFFYILHADASTNSIFLLMEFDIEISEILYFSMKFNTNCSLKTMTKYIKESPSQFS